MNPLAAVYGRVTTFRRRWYARHPEKQDRLPRPVISVGNLVAGGSGKTPVVAALARLLLRAGERPAILSRGYGRRTPADDVVIVSDGRQVLVPARDSGDEPQMLARALPEVPIVVCARRHRAGEVAAARFDVTVMLLDDGFQHLQLLRDVDLLVVSPVDLDEALLPSGFLRESLAASAHADALIVPGSPDDAVAVASALQEVARASPNANAGRRGGPRSPSTSRGASTPGEAMWRVFSATARYEPFRSLNGDTGPAMAPGSTALAVAGIARPQRFFGALAACDLRIVSELAFADHHWFDARDVSRIEQAARDTGARLIVTTEKDAMRLNGITLSMPWVTLPQLVSLAPEPEFVGWMQRRLAAARERLSASADGADR